MVEKKIQWSGPKELLCLFGLTWSIGSCAIICKSGGVKQSGGWGLVSTHKCPQFLCLQWTSKEFKLNTDYSGTVTFTTHWSHCRVQDWVQVWAAVGHLAIAPKAHSRRISKVLNANLWYSHSFWGRARAQLGLVGWVSTNTGCFWVGQGCSHCWLLKALLRKTCYHSCNTDLVGESKSL